MPKATAADFSSIVSSETSATKAIVFRYVPERIRAPSGRGSWPGLAAAP